MEALNEMYLEKNTDKCIREYAHDPYRRKKTSKEKKKKIYEE